MGKIRMAAIAFGTIVGSKSDIYHFNPKGRDDGARYPIVDEDDIDRVISAGLGKKLDRKAAAEFRAKEDPTDLDAMFTRLEAAQGAEDAAGDGAASTALQTTATTAHPAGTTSLNSLDPDMPPSVVSGAPASGGNDAVDAASYVTKSVTALTANIAALTDLDALASIRAAEAAKAEPRVGALKAIDERIAAVQAAA